MRAILIGASGLTGGLLLNNLLKDPVFTSVKLISRKPTGFQQPGISESIINFEDDAAFKKEVTNADVLFCCIGTTLKKVKGDKSAYRKIDYDIAANAAKFCADNGIAKFVLMSSVGANAGSSNFYLMLKGETEDAVLHQAISTVYIMRPSLLVGSRKESRFAESVAGPVMGFFSFFLIGGMARYKAIKAATVAEAMLEAAKQTITGKFICHYNDIVALANKNKQVKQH